MPRHPEIDPAFHLIPKDQIDRVLDQDMCDIGPEFLGFTEVYEALANIIPLHWTVIDLGCAYAPQAFFFARHKKYVGVDLYVKERFFAPNSVFYTMLISQFVEQIAPSFDQSTTFAICSYVPPWHDDNNALVRAAFKNLFTYYPAGNPDRPDRFRLEKTTISEAVE